MKRLWAAGLDRLRKAKKIESGEDQHVRDRHHIKRRGVQPRRRKASGQGVGARQDTENNHGTRQKKTKYAEAAMDIHTACGN